MSVQRISAGAIDSGVGVIDVRNQATITEPRTGPAIDPIRMLQLTIGRRAHLDSIRPAPREPIGNVVVTAQFYASSMGEDSALTHLEHVLSPRRLCVAEFVHATPCVQVDHTRGRDAFEKFAVVCDEQQRADERVERLFQLLDRR